MGSEYCSGYTDILGIWNDGFFCPSQTATNNNVFCCGNHLHKYCCTKKDQVLDELMENSSVSLIIATMVVVSSLLLVATIISCICCPQCPNYDKSSSLYKLEKPRVYRLEPGDSRDSGVTKTLSVSNGSSSPARMTELRYAERQLQPQLQHPATNGHWRQPGQEEGGGDRRRLRRSSDDGGALSHSYTLPHSVSHHSSITLIIITLHSTVLISSISGFRIREEQGWGETVNLDRKYGTVGRKPREQPPAYHILPRASYLVLPQDTPDLLTGTLMQEDIQEAARQSAKVDIIDMERTAEEEDIYQSTKF